MNGPRTPEDLLSYLPGELEPIRARLSYGAERRLVVPSAQLLNGDALKIYITRFARRFDIEPNRYLVSLWSQKYFATVIIPVMALAMMGGRALEADIESTVIVLDRDGEPVALRLPSAFATESGENAASLLTSTHLAPIIEALAGWSGLSRKVFWGNAAHYLEWTMGRFSSETTRPQLPGPMTDALRYVEEDGKSVRRRKVCCLRDRVPCVESCGSLCPERK
ncbi:MAG: siderophore-iron reductase FhuF [Agrobacterium cavarae]|uniref:siderophore-iron reductase FhuF n=1 Tax=Agrobacterium cavarae TaxID=2528239 RepID=UPI0031B274FE